MRLLPEFLLGFLVEFFLMILPKLVPSRMFLLVAFRNSFPTVFLGILKGFHTKTCSIFLLDIHTEFHPQFYPEFHDVVRVPPWMSLIFSPEITLEPYFRDVSFFSHFFLRFQQWDFAEFHVRFHLVPSDISLDTSYNKFPKSPQETFWGELLEKTLKKSEKNFENNAENICKK